MKRWIVVRGDRGPGACLAHLPAALSNARARAVAGGIARGLRSRVRLYRDSERHNPTLVAHGLAPRASYHLTTVDRRIALADLYYVLGDAHAKRIATFIAHELGVSVRISENSRGAAALAAHRTVAKRGMGARAARVPAVPSSTNPSRSAKARAERARLREAFNRKERRALGAARAKSRTLTKAKRVLARHAGRRRRRTGHAYKAGASETVRALRRNPASAAELAQARKTFRTWHAFDARDLVRKDMPREIPRTLVKLGEIPEFIYTSNKWEGKPVTYRHVTKRPRPQLCTGPTGKGLFIVGGRTRVTARGLEH